VTGPIAQAIALVISGRAYLASRERLPTLRLGPTSSGMKFCEFVRFEMHDAAGGIASSPRGWLLRLKAAGVWDLRLTCEPSGNKREPDWRTAWGTGGGPRWIVSAVSDGAPMNWRDDWQVGDQARKDKRIWRVTYAQQAEGREAPGRARNLDRVQSDLRASLIRIHDYAVKTGEKFFREYFAEALTRLDSREPMHGLWCEDVAPADLVSLAGRQLIGAAAKSWVFGGMGWWPDRPGNDEFDDVSARLFDAINAALACGANCDAIDAATG
jgi:hypothetical protein